RGRGVMGDARHADEGRRQAYLAALGIPLWSARVELPGALPAPPLAFAPYVADAAPAHLAPPAFAPAASAPSPLPAPAAPPAGAAVRDPDVREAAAAPAMPVPRPAAIGAGATAVPAAPVSGDPPRLACRVQALAPGWSAVIDLGDAPDLAAAEYRLLDSIARALGAAELPGGQGETLRWPLNRNPALDHGREAMRAWLRHALRLPPGLCLVLGEALAAELQSALGGRPLVAGPGLGELLADTGAKRRLQLALAGQWPQGSHA
ncbi:MAG TPA: hypothetical protein VFV15_03755, partial [Moraxellaceae bacterium]|nr:hypothetical protein [Moraxellaceae bacterium]